jgi:hypothetical protein
MLRWRDRVVQRDRSRSAAHGPAQGVEGLSYPKLDERLLDRTSDTRLMKPRAADFNASTDNTAGLAAEPLTVLLAQHPELARILVAWPTPPIPIRHARLGLVEDRR